MTTVRSLTEIELRRRLILDEERRRIEARHRRAAMAEKNVALPRLAERFDAEVAAGRLPDLTDFFPVETGS